MKKIIRFILVCTLVLPLTGCHIYKKYDIPTQDSAILADYGKALEMPADSASLPYMGWEDVFTDPILQGYINMALANNKDLNNAILNVDIARAQLKGAKLSYLPSLTDRKSVV